MKRIVGIFVALSVVGCASHYESDRWDPHYQNGYNFGNNADGAIIATLASGIVLAQNRDYYKTTAITGQCLCRISSGNSIEHLVPVKFKFLFLILKVKN